MIPRDALTELRSMAISFCAGGWGSIEFWLKQPISSLPKWAALINEKVRQKK